MTEDKPHFRFFPKTYEDGGAFKFSSRRCDVCKKPCVFEYTGNIYVINDEPVCCARCMHSDALANYFSGKGRLFVRARNFSLQDIQITKSEADLEEELMQRTPGVPCVNPFDWPVIDFKPCVYIGRGDEDKLWKSADIQRAMQQFWQEEMNEDHEGPHSHLLVFKQLDGDQYGFAIDFC